MTGDTIVSEKRPVDSQSPTSPTDTIMTGDTLRGDAIIEIQEEDRSSSRTPSVANSSSINEAPSLPGQTSCSSLTMIYETLFILTS
jgi:hypothetical protein